MSLGNGNPREGDKGSNFSFEKSVLKILQSISTATEGGLGAPAVTVQEVGGVINSGIPGSSIAVLSTQTDGRIDAGFSNSQAITLSNLTNFENYITDIASNFSGLVHFELAISANTIANGAFVNVCVGVGSLKDDVTILDVTNTFDTNNLVLSQTNNGFATISGTITVSVPVNNPCFIIGLRNSNAVAASTGITRVTGRVTFEH